MLLFNTDKLSNPDEVKFLFSTSQLNKSVFIKKFFFTNYFIFFFLVKTKLFTST